MAPAKPILAIDLSSRVPVYEQIAGELRTLLVAGRFAPGDALPTVRQLAMDLGVHHNTVAQAYRKLAEEGWLDLRRGRGVRVLPRSGPRAAANAREKFSQQLKRLIAQAVAEGLSPRTIARELGARAKHSPKGNLA